MDDITNYLNQFSNAINGITILGHGFLEIEVLKPIYSAISFVGLHILKPLHNLILDKDIRYSTLVNSFPKMYEELNSTKPSIQIFKVELFKIALPNSELSQNVINVAQEYSHEVCQLISYH